MDCWSQSVTSRTGIHRTTISKWVHQQLLEEKEDVRPPALGIDLPHPPTPWASWEQVRQIQEMLQDRYQILKIEIMQAITELEDRLYTATQTVNFTPVQNRITATLSRLVAASSETKKTLINSVIQRLDGRGGEIIHLTPSPWTRPFF